MWTEGELAFDGSSRPQTRELTPKERDVICRILFDIWYHARKNNTENGVPIIAFDAVPIRMGEGELDLLFAVRDVLDPREG